MQKIDILYTTDHTYIRYMLISLYSLLENNPHLDITVHIIHNNFDQNDYKIIENITTQFGNVNIEFYDFAKIEGLIDEYNIPTWRGTKMANARLFFTHYIKDVDKLLYLDSDTVVMSSLSDLDYYTQTIHMVQDSMPKKHWKNLKIELEKYYNSGVLWIDVNKWKESDCDQKILSILDSNIPYIFPDQDLLNMALKDEIASLPPEYNLFSTDAYYNSTLLYKYYKQSGIERYTKDEMATAKKNPIILHSTPFYDWTALDANSIHPYSHIYDEYLYKIFGKVDKDSCSKIPNPFLFKLFLYSKLICPQEIKNTIKKYIKK